MKRDPYEVLGVDREATAEQIRKARRKLAWDLHADLNPDPACAEQLAEVNAAYEILGDPQRRLEFDALGAGALVPIEEEAENSLEALFESAIDHDEGEGLVVRALLVLALTFKDYKDQLFSLQTKRRTLRKKRAQVRKKVPGLNAVHQAIDRRLRNTDKEIIRMRRMIQVYETMAKLLDDYEQVEIDPHDPDYRDPDAITALLQ